MNQSYHTVLELIGSLAILAIFIAAIISIAKVPSSILETPLVEAANDVLFTADSYALEQSYIALSRYAQSKITMMDAVRNPKAKYTNAVDASAALLLIISQIKQQEDERAPEDRGNIPVAHHPLLRTGNGIML